MRFPKVEECDFDRQFLFDEYIPFHQSISHRYDLKRVEKLNNCSFVACKKFNCLATFMMHDSLLIEFPSRFFRHHVDRPTQQPPTLSRQTPTQNNSESPESCMPFVIILIIVYFHRRSLYEVS